MKESEGGCLFLTPVATHLITEPGVRGVDENEKITSPSTGVPQALREGDSGVGRSWSPAAGPPLEVGFLVSSVVFRVF